MIRVMVLPKKGTLNLHYPQEKLGEALKSDYALIWVDLDGESAEVCEPLLRDVFKFHPLAVEDALYERNIPKIDDWNDYIYIILKAFHFDPRMDVLEMERIGKLDVFKSRHLLVTHHREPIPAITKEWQRCERDERHTAGGAGKLLYLIMDGVADDYMMAMDKLDDTIDAVEDEVFDNPTPRTLERIFSLKRAVLSLRRSLSPQREVLNKLARDKYKTIDPKNKIYYRDVYDHLVRLFELNESLRDLVGGALDMYLSVTSNKTNDIMKVLTIVTTLFVPLTFVTGFWGMNFYEPAPNTAWCNPSVMWATIALMALIPVSILVWMRGKKWL